MTDRGEVNVPTRHAQSLSVQGRRAPIADIVAYDKSPSSARLGATGSVNLSCSRWRVSPGASRGPRKEIATVEQSLRKSFRLDGAHRSVLRSASACYMVWSRMRRHVECELIRDRASGQCATWPACIPTFGCCLIHHQPTIKLLFLFLFLFLFFFSPFDSLSFTSNCKYW